MKKEFEFIEREPSVRVVCRKSSRQSLFQKLRDALEESAPDLSIEEIKSQDVFSGACLFDLSQSTASAGRTV